MNNRTEKLTQPYIKLCLESFLNEPLVFRVVGRATFPLSLSVLIKREVFAAAFLTSLTFSLAFVVETAAALALVAAGALEDEVFAPFFFPASSSFSSELLSELAELELEAAEPDAEAALEAVELFFFPEGFFFDRILAAEAVARAARPATAAAPKLKKDVEHDRFF